MQNAGTQQATIDDNKTESLLRLLSDNHFQRHAIANRIERFAYWAAGTLLLAKMVIAVVHLFIEHPHGKIAFLGLAGGFVLLTFMAHSVFLITLIKEGFSRNHHHQRLSDHSQKGDHLLESILRYPYQVRKSVLETVDQQHQLLSKRITFLAGSLDKTGIVPAIFMLFLSFSRFAGGHHSQIEGIPTLDVIDYGLMIVLFIYFLGGLAHTAREKLEYFRHALQRADTIGESSEN